MQNGLAYIPSYSRDASLHIPEIRWITLETELEMSIGAMRPGDLIALDYDWNIEDLQSIKQISQRVHEGGGQFGVQFPIAEIHTSILDRPEWQLAPVPVFQWPAVPKNHDVDQRRGTRRGGNAAVHNSRSRPGNLLCFERLRLLSHTSCKNVASGNSGGSAYLGSPDFGFTAGTS